MSRAPAGAATRVPFRVAPMLATLVDNPVDRAGWVAEEKYDGIRLLAYLRYSGAMPASWAPWLLLLLAAAGCATARVSPASRRAPDGFEQTGIASWYGRQHQGKRTASGEIYEMHGLTAAHPTLPFGTWVRVINLDNGRSVDVRINDRGPFVDGRVIDLSYAAARQLGALGPGLVPVALKVVPGSESDSNAGRAPPEK